MIHPELATRMADTLGAIARDLRDAADEAGPVNGAAMPPEARMMSATAPAPPIPMGLEEVQERLDRLYEATGRLEERLAPVLAPDQPGAVAREVTRGASPIGDRVAGIVTQLDTAVDRLEVLRSRLEV